MRMYHKIFQLGESYIKREDLGFIRRKQHHLDLVNIISKEVPELGAQLNHARILRNGILGYKRTIHDSDLDRLESLMSSMELL